MITLIIYGRFLFVPSLMLTQFFSISANMPLCTSAFPYDLYNVTMVVNSTMLATAISSFLLEPSFDFLVHTLPPKTGKLNDPYDPSMIFCAPFLSKPLFHLVFGPKHFAPPPFFWTSDPPNHVLSIHRFNLFFLIILTIPPFGSLDAYVSQTSPPPPNTNLTLVLFHAFILDPLMITRALVATIPLLVVFSSLVMLHSMSMSLPILPFLPQNRLLHRHLLSHPLDDPFSRHL